MTVEYKTIAAANGRRLTARFRPVPCRARTEEAMAERLEAVGCEARVPGENEIVVTVRAHRRARSKTRKLAIRRKAFAAGYVFAEAERANDARRAVNERLDRPELRKPLSPLTEETLEAWSAACKP